MSLNHLFHFGYLWLALVVVVVVVPSALPFVTGWGVVSTKLRRVGRMEPLFSSPLILSDLTLAAAAVTPILHDDDVLAALFGSTNRRDDFLNHDLGKHIVRLSRSDLELASPLNHVVDMQDLYNESSDETYIMVLRRRGSREFLNKTIMSTYGHLEEYIQSGGSAVVSVAPNAKKVGGGSGKLLEFKDSVETSLQRRTSINIYHSGPSAVALNRHYDSYDVIVIQLDGEKEWEIEENGVWTNTTLQRGDVLYLPQGIWHAATTSSGFDCSTHATIGLLDD